jgi:hypothetical protein
MHIVSKRPSDRAPGACRRFFVLPVFFSLEGKAPLA